MQNEPISLQTTQTKKNKNNRLYRDVKRLNSVENKSFSRWFLFLFSQFVTIEKSTNEKPIF